MPVLPANPLPPYPDFASAAQGVVAFLGTRVPMGVWNVTRHEGRLLIILHPSAGNGYGVKAGDSMVYDETMCRRMVEGQAPNIVPDVDEDAALRDVPVRKLVPVHTYISFPLQRADGSLFGTLCGWDPLRSSVSLHDHQPLIELLSRQLSTILQFDLERETAWRDALRHETSAMTDALTGVGSRRAHELTCEREEMRCREIGHRLSTIVVDLDGLKAINDRHGHAAGDSYLRRAAQALRAHARRDAHLARTGGDEFVVLLPGCAVEEARQVVERLRASLADAGVQASFGCAERKPHRGLADALRTADAAMYVDKQSRRETPA